MSGIGINMCADFLIKVPLESSYLISTEETKPVLFRKFF